LEDTLSEEAVYSARPRICDLGYLREPYRMPSGQIDYRCSAEPVTIYLSKGGKLENTVGRKCLCNALMANIGHAQVRNGKYTEQPLVTTGNDLTEIDRFLPEGATTYTAEEVVQKLLSFAPRPSIHTDTNIACPVGVEAMPELEEIQSR
jgi:nitronate monooxygenase